MKSRSKTSAKGSKNVDALFKIDTREIHEGGLRLREPIPSEWLDGVLHATGLEPDQPGGLDLEISETKHREYLVRGTARASVNATCISCLEGFAVPVKAEICAILSQNATELPVEDQELEPAALECEAFQGDAIVLDGLVRDAILLDLPMNPRCRPECEAWRDHLPPQGDEDIDPRLLPLKKARLRKED